MKRYYKSALALLLCIMLQMSGMPVIAASARDKTSKEKEEKDEIETSVSAKMIRKPPWVITITESLQKDLSDSSVSWIQDAKLSLVARSDGNVLGYDKSKDLIKDGKMHHVIGENEWDCVTMLEVKNIMKSKEIEAEGGYLDIGVSWVAESFDGFKIEEAKKGDSSKDDKGKENKSQDTQPADGQDILDVLSRPVEEDPYSPYNKDNPYVKEEKEKLKKQIEAKGKTPVSSKAANKRKKMFGIQDDLAIIWTAKAEMNCTARGYGDFDGNDFQAYIPGDPDGPVEGSILGAANLQGKDLDYNFTLELEIYNDDTVFATITLNNAIPGPQVFGRFKGKLTCEEELETKRKMSQKYPIWGVWTNAGHYEAMPRIKDDEKTKKNLDKRIGKWLLLKYGKGEDTCTYQMVTSTAEAVTLETGILAAYPGSFKCTDVKILTFNRSDPQNPVEKDGTSHLMNFRYNTVGDTISGTGIGGTLVRVRDPSLISTWNSISPTDPMPNFEKGNPASKSLPKGIWYKFEKIPEDKMTAEEKNSADNKTMSLFQSQYTFTCIDTTGESGVKKEMGTAVFMPVAGDDFIQLIDIESILYPASGGEPEEYISEPYDLWVSSEGAETGLISLNSHQYYRFVPDALKGHWSTMADIHSPQPEKGRFEAEDEEGNTIELNEGQQWRSFDDGTGTFRHLVYCSDRGKKGYLVETGKYRRTEVDQVLMSEVTGSFYALSGNEADGWKDRDLPEGDVCYRFQTDASGNLTFQPWPEVFFKLSAQKK